MAAAEDHDDDRRVHRRQRRREGTHEDVEPARHEEQLRRGLPDTDRLPKVPPDEREGAPGEEPVQKFYSSHVLVARLRVAEPGSSVPNQPNAEPNVSGQRGGQRENARVYQSATRALARGGQIPAAGYHRAETSDDDGQAQ